VAEHDGKTPELISLINRAIINMRFASMKNIVITANDTDTK
jgi:hypothetical protein